MAYRGDDLDLRTPQSWGQPSMGPSGRDQPASGDLGMTSRPSAYPGGRADPIWVDDNVMACCNHAYDLAVAHRAAEVRLEHLINAMTLNDQIAQVMEARGIGVAALRRESGAILASEIPSGPVNGKPSPRRSEALEEALRQASERAYLRRAPVGVDDILHVLFDMKRDLPGLQLLRRHAAAWGSRNGSDPRSDLRLEPLPHLARGMGGDPRYSPQDEPRSRYAPQSPAADYYTTSSTPPTPRPSREPASASLDMLQNNRLDALDRAVRDLGLDLADERKSLQQFVGDLQRKAEVHADDTVRFRGGLTDRLAALEDTLQRTRGEPSSVSAAMFDRIGGIERTLDARNAEAGHALTMLGERLASLEAAVRRPVDGTNVERKVDALERTFSLILDRMTGVERQLGTGKSVDLTPLQTRLADIERNLTQRVTQSFDLAPITDLLSGMETRIAGLERALDNRTAETGRTVSFVADRLRGFEETLGGQKSHVTDRVGQVDTRLAQIERALSAYAERAVDTGNAHERDLAELHEALVRLNANQQVLSSNLDQWRLDSTGDISVVSNRLKTLEETSQQRDPLVQQLAQQVEAIHQSVVKPVVEQVPRRRHSGFWHWLLGTHEWYAASYDTARWRARQAADVVRSMDATRPAQRPTPAAPPPSRIARR